jgi:hypothetical protein
VGALRPGFTGSGGSSLLVSPPSSVFSIPTLHGTAGWQVKLRFADKVCLDFSVSSEYFRALILNPIRRDTSECAEKGRNRCVNREGWLTIVLQALYYFRQKPVLLSIRHNSIGRTARESPAESQNDSTVPMCVPRCHSRGVGSVQIKVLRQ